MVAQAKGHCVSAALSKAPPRVRSNLKRIVIALVMPLILPHTHTLGSNSTATQGPSVVELITFAALSWSVIVLIVIVHAMWRRWKKGKQSIKDHVLELYNHATWEDLVVPALDTVFSVGWCAPLD